MRGTERGVRSNPRVYRHHGRSAYIFGSKLAFVLTLMRSCAKRQSLQKVQPANLMLRSRHADVDAPTTFPLCHSIGTDRPSACKWAAIVIGQKGLWPVLIPINLFEILCCRYRGLIRMPALKERLISFCFMSQNFGAARTEVT